MEGFIEERAFDVCFKGLIGFTRPRRQGRSGGRGYCKQRKKPYFSPFKAIPPSQLSSRCFCKSFPLYPLVSSSFWITILVPGLLNPAKEIHKRPKLMLPPSNGSFLRCLTVALFIPTLYLAHTPHLLSIDYVPGTEESFL